MKSAIHILALLAAAFAPIARADQATSADYSMAISIEAGGGQITSADYTQNIIVTPIAGRAVATFSDSMIFGFATRFNNPPIAADDVRSHPQDAPISIAAAALLANDFEPEGDLLSILSVDPASAAGGTVTINGQTVTYTPPTGLNTSDQFHYTVADSNGDVSTATVTLAIAPPIANQPFNTVALFKQPDGKLLLRLRQLSGSTEYIIEFTDDLSKTDWQTLTDLHAGADGIVELIINPAANKQTFFRALTY
ncbi:MAG TPA: cadherin-like domain-containing protein [Verrucomicrobiae bacterium]|jgi:hypothetical protein